MASSKKRFTYGDQFEESKTPLLELLRLIEAHEPDTAALQEAIRQAYFQGHGSPSNSQKMAMNCRLSLKAYGLIDNKRITTPYMMTPQAKKLKQFGEEGKEEHMFEAFAHYILTELHGLTMLRVIENIRARGEQSTLEYISEELNDIGLKVPPNSTYVSTMRAWLAKARVFRGASYEINWDIAYDLLNVDPELLDALYGLTIEQKFFLLSAVSLGIDDWTASNAIANHTRSVYKVRLTTKNLVKDVLEPLEGQGFIETRKTTGGRGAKPHDVRLTEKTQEQILEPLLQNLSELTEITSSELNRTFESVVADLKHHDKHVKGIALELFAIWIIRLLSLRFSEWRMKSYQSTGGAEVDVMAASDKVVYSRWQIQCKNIAGNVDVDVIAKEVGLTFLTKADVVMIVTTGSFTRVAVDYANLVNDNSRYYVILLEGEDINRIVEDRTRIIEILNTKARRVFAKKELGIADFDEAVEDDFEAELGESIAMQGDFTFPEGTPEPPDNK